MQTVEIYSLLQRPNLPQYYYYEIQPIPGISEVGVCMKNKPARQNLENHLRSVYSREKVSERRMFHQPTNCFIVCICDPSGSPKNLVRNLKRS